VIVVPLTECVEHVELTAFPRLTRRPEVQDERRGATHAVASVGPNNPSMAAIVGSLILAASVGAIVYMLKPEPEWPPCELKKTT